MSLRDGTKKMSKSDPSDLSRINLTDDADTIAKKIKKAKTDPAALPSEPAGLKGRPEAENLIGIYAALTGATVDARTLCGSVRCDMPMDRAAGQCSRKWVHTRVGKGSLVLDLDSANGNIWIAEGQTPGI